MKISAHYTVESEVIRGVVVSSNKFQWDHIRSLNNWSWVGGSGVAVSIDSLNTIITELTEIRDFMVQRDDVKEMSD